jgi:hypothetical protein
MYAIKGNYGNPTIQDSNQPPTFCGRIVWVLAFFSLIITPFEPIFIRHKASGQLCR